MTRIASAIAVLLVCTAAASAQHAPVAVVEDVRGNPPGVELMAYVTAGQTIRLGRDDTIVLSYLKSCSRETITAGQVTVGSEHSTVEAGGRINREKTACDVARMDFAVKQADRRTGGMVFRGTLREQQGSPLLKPQFVLYGLSPVVELKPGSRVVIERADRAGETIELTPAGRRMRGALYDFADDNRALVRGGVYRARMGTVEVLFQIHPDAQPGRAPIVGRLLRLSN
jgi:hypothetical protein